MLGLNGRHGGNLDFKLENYMLESPVCVSLLNLARVLNVDERRRGSGRCSGGRWLGARAEQSSKDGLRGGMQVVGCIQFDQSLKLQHSPAPRLLQKRDEAASCSKNSHRRAGGYHG